MITLMPVINAHSSSAGVWQSICTLGGFKLVQVEGASDNSPHSSKGNHCSLSQFSTVGHSAFTHSLYQLLALVAITPSYWLETSNTRYLVQSPRSPPTTFFTDTFF
ncbi:hypothetical protein AHAT_04820 [Agarivorans sp. Toyoura001]|nr:hypothetical protein AHAT_04820 [Agarivorans sp. Toyoura001]